MTAQVRKPAPTISVEAYVRGETQPRTVDLAELRGSWVVLFFYPRDFTFVCPTELQALARLHDEFTTERTIMLAASTDSWYAHKAWFESDVRLRDITFPVIADTSHELSAAFGVLIEDGCALRGTFIIDPEGIVRHMQVNDLDVGRNVEETLRLLRALRTGELCPESWEPRQATLTAVATGGVEVPA